MALTKLRWRQGAAAIGIATMLLGTAAACSDDSSSTAESSTSTTAPEEKISSDAEVAAGLQQMITISAEVAAAGTDKAAATEADDKLEPIWKSIEGTIKANDPNVYTDMEDNLSLLETGAKSGDTTKTSKGAADMATAANTYLANYPG